MSEPAGIELDLNGIVSDIKESLEVAYAKGYDAGWSDALGEAAGKER